MMVTFSKSVFEELINEAKKYAPIEACGYLAGTSNVITKHYPMKNIDNSPEHFSFDPVEQFAVIKKIRSAGLTVYGIYHSHPKSPPRPSKEDIRLAFDPNILYVIISLAKKHSIKAYSICNKKIIEQEIVLMPDTGERYLSTWLFQEP